jgi:hypothetical protein
MGDFEVVDDENGCEKTWTGIRDEALAAPVPDSKETPRNAQILPSGEELQIIKDAANLFRSQSFKLQVRRDSTRFFRG